MVDRIIKGTLRIVSIAFIVNILYAMIVLLLEGFAGLTVDQIRIAAMIGIALVLVLIVSITAIVRRF